MSRVLLMCSLHLVFASLCLSNTKVAFVTSLYGHYEKALKKPAIQTIPADFYAFSDRDDLEGTGWNVVNTPYHLYYSSIRQYHNSVFRNKHNFNTAKFYKTQFHRIPLIQRYDVVIWCDATLEIRNTSTAEFFYHQVIEKNVNFAVFEHTVRNGNLSDEVQASLFYRYTSTHWARQEQPRQDVVQQYEEYSKDGFTERWWKARQPSRVVSDGFGVWVTCFVVYDMRQIVTQTFLDLWYQHILRYSTQDQVSFPFVCWKLDVWPYTLPGGVSTGNSDVNTFYFKHAHDGIIAH